MSIVIQVFIKYMREMFRSKARVGILIIAPIIFFSFFGFIFLSGFEGTEIRKIGFVNDDQGYSNDFTTIIPDDYIFTNIEKSTLSNLYIDLFQNHFDLFSDTDIKVNVILYSNVDSMIDEVEDRSLSLGVYFPKNYTTSLLSGFNTLSNSTIFAVPENQVATIETYGDPSADTYQSALSIVTASLYQFSSSLIGIEALLGESPTGGYISFDSIGIQSEEDGNEDMSFFVSGFIVFLVILQAINVAGIVTLEKENKTIQRMKLSNMKGWELFSGVTLGQMVAYTAQFLISIIVLFFFDVRLGFTTWMFVYLITQLTNVNIVGISLIVASFVKTRQDASTIVGIGSSPLGFLSGAFLPLPEVYIVKSINLQYWDLIPTYHATIAIHDIMFFNATFTDVIRPIFGLIIYAIILYVLGVYLFQRKVIKSDT